MISTNAYKTFKLINHPFFILSFLLIIFVKNLKKNLFLLMNLNIFNFVIIFITLNRYQIDVKRLIYKLVGRNYYLKNEKKNWLYHVSNIYLLAVCIICMPSWLIIYSLEWYAIGQYVQFLHTSFVIITIYNSWN